MRFLSKFVLLIFLVLPGAATATISGYWVIRDYSVLIQADTRVRQLGQQGGQESELATAIYVADSHRINVFAEGVWILLGLAMFGYGTSKVLYLGAKDY